MASTGIQHAATITDATVDAFLDLMQQFLQAMEEVFPECVKVRQYKLALTARLALCSSAEDSKAVAQQAITGFHGNMQQYYGRVMAKDETLLGEDIDLMKNIDLPGKWTPDLHGETKDAIWEYIQKLCEHANIYSMYSKVPGNMMSCIETMAHNLASQISEGNMTLRDLNIQQVSQQVLSSLNPEDLQQFAQSLNGSDMLENVSNMYTMMSSMLRSQQM